MEAVFLENKLKIDDPVGAVSVHGINGLWGCLALSLFIVAVMVTAGTEFGHSEGPAYGDASQFTASLSYWQTLFM